MAMPLLLSRKREKPRTRPRAAEAPSPHTTRPSLHFGDVAMDERGRRIGLNEALFREVNERVRGINAEFAERFAESQFVCECGDDGCTARVVLPVAEYERIRSDATLFVVCPGHEIEAVESVVAKHEGYYVIRKRTGEPRRIAEQTDPRE
jgi:hypothetical protein